MYNFYFSEELVRRHGFTTQMDPSASHGRTTVRVVFAIRHQPIPVAAGRTQRRAQIQRTLGALPKCPRGIKSIIVAIIIIGKNVIKLSGWKV